MTKNSLPMSARLRDRFFAAVVDSATEYAIISLDLGGRVTSWNEGARRILGWCEDEMLGQSADIFFTPEDRACRRLESEMCQALSAGRAGDDRWHCRRDGSRFWARGQLTPLQEPGGHVEGFVKVLRDRTEQRLAAEAERSYAELLSGVMAASNDCIKVLDLEGRLLFMNDWGKSLMEVHDFDAVRGRHWTDFLEDGREEAAAALEAARRGKPAGLQTVAKTMSGTPKWWDVQVSAIAGPDGQPEKLLSVSRDITDLKAAEDQQKLLMSELAHRVKNTLSVAQAIASQSIRGDLSLAEARELVSGRLIALSKAHDVLLQGNWTQASMRAIVDQSIRAHGAERFEITGPDLLLSSKAGLSLALVIHELATNAAKYGALSAANGRVVLTWSIDPIEGALSLRLTWREMGGPEVERSPVSGFGSKLIERTLSQALKASLELAYRPEGLTATIEAPLSAWQES